MGRRKNRKRRKNFQQGLSGVEQVMKHPIANTVTKGGLVILAAIAAGGAGAAIGKHSLVAGLPVALIGFHKKNPYLTSAGLGLILSNGFQNQNNQVASMQGVEGLDMKQLAEEAKDRVGTFFKNFSDKLYLSRPEPTGTGGLEGDDQVTYFMNPYSSAEELDMSAIDRVQEQIANMNQGISGMNAIEEPDREF